MALRIFKISEYNHLAETRQFESVCQMLKEQYEHSTEECIIIGNYNIEGVELDALLITSGGYRILEFKNWGGTIVARENGAWTSRELIIEGGTREKTPYEQIRLNKSRVTKGLGKLLGAQPQMISAAIIFWQDAEIDTSGLSDTVKSWLTVCDNRHLSCILEGLDTKTIADVGLIPRKLRIEEFSTESDHAQKVPINETYEPEASTNLFDEIEGAIAQRPDMRTGYTILKDYGALSTKERDFLDKNTNLGTIVYNGLLAGKCGDTNDSGAVTSEDATKILVDYADALVNDKTIRVYDYPYGDANRDNKVSSEDATVILIEYAKALVDDKTISYVEIK